MSDILFNLLIIPIVVFLYKLLDLWCEYDAEKTLGNCHDIKSFISWKRINKVR